MGKSLERNESVSTLNKKRYSENTSLFWARLPISVGYMDPGTGQRISPEEANLVIPYSGFIDE
jgi:hypothetical protein